MSVNVAWFPDYGHIVAGIFWFNLDINSAISGVWSTKTQSLKVLFMLVAEYPKTPKKLMLKMEKFVMQ